mmetsp:Transcript_32519/g.69257  ORF Transcript_32519/g.69257 Transcript_32519/m.69257 type:complete len:267 (-) Transcript_32519:34-834(-)
MPVFAVALVICAVAWTLVEGHAGSAYGDGSSWANATHADGIIYVIRHGEKNSIGNHLDKIGLERAQHVADLWDGTRFPAPKAIFANLYDNEFNSVELVEPLAHRLGLPVNSSENRKHNWQAAGKILHALEAKGSPILVAWEHRHIVRLLVDMGCSSTWLANWWSGLWPRTDFDEIFIATFRDGACVDLTREREHFLVPQTVWCKYVVAVALPFVLLVAVWSLWKCRSSDKHDNHSLASFLRANLMPWEQHSSSISASSLHETFLGA